MGMTLSEFRQILDREMKEQSLVRPVCLKLRRTRAVKTGRIIYYLRATIAIQPGQKDLPPAVQERFGFPVWSTGQFVLRAVVVDHVSVYVADGQIIIESPIEEPALSEWRAAARDIVKWIARFQKQLPSK
jgi:hypothetical protein